MVMAMTTPLEELSELGTGTEVHCMLLPEMLTRLVAVTTTW